MKLNTEWRRRAMGDERWIFSSNPYSINTGVIFLSIFSHIFLCHCCCCYRTELVYMNFFFFYLLLPFIFHFSFENSRLNIFVAFPFVSWVGIKHQHKRRHQKFLEKHPVLGIRHIRDVQGGVRPKLQTVWIRKSVNSVNE